jgi:hypothetical protein
MNTVAAAWANWNRGQLLLFFFSVRSILVFKSNSLRAFPKGCLIFGEGQL